MTLQQSVTGTDLPDNRANSNSDAETDHSDAANAQDRDDVQTIEDGAGDLANLAKDNGIDLAAQLSPYFRPDEQTIVCGALDKDKVQALADAGVELVISLQPDDELSFDEKEAVTQAGMAYEHLPISGAQDLKQLNILAFDKILRQYHGKKTAMHCKSAGRVGAAMALRTGWLRGRKMDTAMARGRSHGLNEMFEQEVYNRLLVPR